MADEPPRTANAPIISVKKNLGKIYLLYVFLSIVSKAFLTFFYHIPVFSWHLSLTYIVIESSVMPLLYKGAHQRSPG
jgi:hypothetical protein